MKNPVNILIFVHGMIPQIEPVSFQSQFEEFISSMESYKPELKQLIKDKIYVQWGHSLPNEPVKTPDQNLTEAQKYVGDRTAYNAVKTKPGENNVVICDYVPIVGKKLVDIREGTILHGFGDVLYYCSEDGEKNVRKVVFKTILDCLEKYSDDNVRLHFWGHSLGVTVIHDFLYGIFNKKKKESDFIEQSNNDKTADKYIKWKDKAEIGELELGSFSCAASQLPLFIMRKQSMVDIFAGMKGNTRALNPEDIGIKSGKSLKWQIFYDKHDLLGFPTRELYSPNDRIKDRQVNCGILPPKSHSGYWTNSTVISETAELIFKNAGE